MEKEKEALISVIVPIYNTEKYLEKCLDSIVGQSYRHLEIIIVDDGSSDGSSDICDRYAAMDSRIKVISHGENLGLSAARNSGLDIAAGEYFCFADSDDWLEIDMYQFLMDDILSTGADIAVCGFFRTFDDLEMSNDKLCTHRVLERTKALKLLLQDRVLRNFFWCKLYKRDLFDGIRMPEGKIFEDILTQHLIFEKARKVVLHNVPKYHYLKRSDSILGSIDGCMNRDYHAALYERVRYFFAKGEKRFSRQAATIYMNALCNSYNFHINSGDEQACAEFRERYIAFSRENYNDCLARFFYDLAFSNSPGALLIFKVYYKYRIVKKIIRDEGFRGFYQKVLGKIRR